MTLQGHPFLFGLLITLGITFLVQSFYYLYYFLAPLLFSHPASSGKKHPVSVIICARNEEANLREFLPAVLEQDYPGYEVIVVNDCSDDESFEILGEYLKKYPAFFKNSGIIFNRRMNKLPLASGKQSHSCLK